MDKLQKVKVYESPTTSTRTIFQDLEDAPKAAVIKYLITKEQLEDLISEVDVDGYLLPLGRQQILKQLGVE